jgi:hypothetical protein
MNVGGFANTECRFSCFIEFQTERAERLISVPLLSILVASYIWGFGVSLTKAAALFGQSANMDSARLLAESSA